jgi:hypothetical protein
MEGKPEGILNLTYVVKGQGVSFDLLVELSLLVSGVSVVRQSGTACLNGSDITCQI